MTSPDTDSSLASEFRAIPQVEEKFRAWSGTWIGRTTGPNYLSPFVRSISAPEVLAAHKPEDDAYEALANTIASTIANAVAGGQHHEVIPDVVETLRTANGSSTYPGYIVDLMADSFARSIDIIALPETQEPLDVSSPPTQQG